ncbi:uncharacterized protein LOC130657766 [Hydractinia symbiolongicarpus]|uniref:uncharacterized protein LOC130657766 n=1 Tax=Hydractinia symbiolongicarpus TaxID=13093 RepID=UPI00254C5E7E|nr:uncharacterized protein LOC130657766 [Hydractinia symbiolongicarpus]
MFAAGFWLAFCLFYVFSPIILRKQYCCDKERYREVHIGSSVAFGLVVGVLTTSLYRFGVFLIGKCLGILVALFILHSAVDVHTTSKLLISGIVTIMAFIFGSLTWRCERPLLILSTSLLGSFFVLCGIDIFVRSNFSIVVYSVLLYVRDALVVSLKNKIKVQDTTLPKYHSIQQQSALSPIFIAAWFFLTIFSAFVQCQFTAKDIKEGGNICPFTLQGVCRCLLPCCCAKNGMDEKPAMK